MHWLFLIVVAVLCAWNVNAHQAKELDDSILYQIAFEYPKIEIEMGLARYLPRFYTHDKEIYECLIPEIEEKKEEKEHNQPELSPYALLQPIFTSPGCSYRIEAYWSYEICHGRHVRQYHEEREGKNVKFQEYYLGTWNEEKTKNLLKTWEENHKSGVKYKTTKIDNIQYPYFEVEMTDGTLCEIINAPRTTAVRYVCYPHGKNEIYSFKETSSCNYEAIIFTSALCMMPAFHPEETKMLSIKCFNSPTNAVPPISMIREQRNEYEKMEELPWEKLSKSDPLFDVFQKTIIEPAEHITRQTEKDRAQAIIDQLNGVDVNTTPENAKLLKTAPVVDITPIKEFISGKNCLTGGTGWWKYEFCYGRHVRQFHKDKQSETELYLGFFSVDSHKQWVILNPEKGAKRPGYGNSLWHHYDKGTYCVRTGMPRAVDVKLTCTPTSTSLTIVSMYLLEPKTCQYILVVESAIICDIIKIADEYGLVHDEQLQSLLQSDSISGDNQRTNKKVSAENTKDKHINHDKTDASDPFYLNEQQRLADENA